MSWGWVGQVSVLLQVTSNSCQTWGSCLPGPDRESQPRVQSFHVSASLSGALGGLLLKGQLTGSRNNTMPPVESQKLGQRRAPRPGRGRGCSASHRSVIAHLQERELMALDACPEHSRVLS